MMRMNIFRAYAFVSLLASTVNSAPVLKITTFASGSQDGVTSATSATLVTTFNPGFSAFTFSLDVFKGVKVTQAHFHCSPAGVSGPIIVYFYGLNPTGVNVNGKLSSGTLGNSAILKNVTGCPVTITNIASLYSAIEKGLIYLNVHTVKNPGGEVRGQVFVNPVFKYTTYASGSQDGITSPTSATLASTFKEDLSSLSFSLDVFKGVKVTQAHFHCSPAGVSGPIVVYFFGLDPSGVNINGKLSSGTLTNSAILKNITGCPVTITNIASLYSAVTQGLVYLNVHTVKNPAGEVRGQVF
jgi:hypothetical protein